MTSQAEVTQQVSPATKRTAADRARVRATAARWDLAVAIFLFAVLIIIIILLFQGIGIEFVAPVAIFGLAMVWLVGWRRGRQLYESFYNEELAKLQQDLKKNEKPAEETIEDKVQKALRARWR